MGGGNGAKSKQARERNAKAAAGGPKSQLKTNEAAMSIKCKICMQTFQGTAGQKILEQHADNKHSKNVPECFPDFIAA